MAGCGGSDVSPLLVTYERPIVDNPDNVVIMVPSVYIEQ